MARRGRRSDAGPDNGRSADAGPSATRGRAAIAECGLLAVACYVSFWLVTRLVSRLHSISADDDLVGGVWAVIATIVVSRRTYQQSVTAGISRIAGTAVSFAFCLVYLIFLPFHVWAMALLVGISALAMMLLGRPDDAAAAAITTTVLIGLAALTRQHAWEQPILRLADTVVGVAVGVGAAWLGRVLIRQPSGQEPPGRSQPQK
jgi:Fusaric acid resistance protein-like